MYDYWILNKIANVSAKTQARVFRQTLPMLTIVGVHKKSSFAFDQGADIYTMKKLEESIVMVSQN